MDKLIINLLLIMLQLVPIVFIMISKLLAEEKLNRRVFVNLTRTLPSTIQVATRPRRLFVPQKVVLLRAVCHECRQFLLALLIDSFKLLLADPLVVFQAENGE